MSTILPDCMMPDGAAPCLGYRQLADERDALRALLAEARNHVSDDVGWSYEEPSGWLADRIDAALRGPA